MEVSNIGPNKYFGILKDFDFDNITRDTIHILIEKDIFDVNELTDHNKFQFEYFDLKSSNGKMPFNEIFTFDRKEYTLKNDVVAEMIDRKNWMLNDIDSTESIKIQSITNEIEVLVAGEFIVEKKIKVLEENYRKYFNEIENKEYYSFYKNRTEVNFFETWEDYFRIDFIWLRDFEALVKYLKGDDNYLPNPFKTDWDEYFIFSKISDYCTMKHNEILGLKTVDAESDSKGLDLSKQILLFEKLRYIDNWDDLSAHKKAKLVSLLINKSEDNIRKVYGNVEKKDSNLTDKFKKDNLEVENLIKDILG